jgi:hypothetical protein
VEAEARLAGLPLISPIDQPGIAAFGNELFISPVFDQLLSPPLKEPRAGCDADRAWTIRYGRAPVPSVAVTAS